MQVLKWAAEDHDRKHFRQMLSRAVTEMMEVHETAASTIEELEMKIRIGKEMFTEKELDEAAKKAAALSSDEDAPPKKMLKKSPGSSAKKGMK